VFEFEFEFEFEPGPAFGMFILFPFLPFLPFPAAALIILYSDARKSIDGL